MPLALLLTQFTALVPAKGFALFSSCLHPRSLDLAPFSGRVRTYLGCDAHEVGVRSGRCPYNTISGLPLRVMALMRLFCCFYLSWVHTPFFLRGVYLAARNCVAVPGAQSVELPGLCLAHTVTPEWPLQLSPGFFSWGTGLLEL